MFVFVASPNPESLKKLLSAARTARDVVFGLYVAERTSNVNGPYTRAFYKLNSSLKEWGDK